MLYSFLWSDTRIITKTLWSKQWSDTWIITKTLWSKPWSDTWIITKTLWEPKTRVVSLQLDRHADRHANRHADRHVERIDRIDPDRHFGGSCHRNPETGILNFGLELWNTTNTLYKAFFTVLYKKPLYQNCLEFWILTFYTSGKLLS